MENKKLYPLYTGGRPCDGTTYRLRVYSVLPDTEKLVAEGVNGSGEKNRNFF